MNRFYGALPFQLAVGLLMAIAMGILQMCGVIPGIEEEYAPSPAVHESR